MRKTIASDFDLNFTADIAQPYLLEMSHWDRVGLVPRRRTERKGWVYAATFNEDFFAAMAVVDAGYGGTAFVYLFDRHTRKLTEERISVPLAFENDFAADLYSRWQIGDKNRQWRIEPLENAVRCSFSSESFTLDFVLTLATPGFNALSPSKGRPFNFTYKNLLLPVQFAANVDGVSYRREDTSGSIDFSLGYPPRETRWNWASMIGQTEGGTPLALNLVAHHNESLENSIWLGTEILRPGKAAFSYKKPMEKNTTLINCDEHDLQIKFEPEGCRKEHVNYLAISSDFVQPFGRFTGSLRYEGKNHSFSGLGVVEDHFARW